MRQLRKQSRVSYAETEEPALDEYIFCAVCQDFVYEYCSIHGPLLVVPDDKVPSPSPYPPHVPHAALTVPRVFLHLAPSVIPGAGLGVFTTLTLPSGVRFGPYRGKKSKEVTSSYCWQMYDRDGKRSHVVDAGDPAASNWMRYVNCSRHWCEQNLVAFQYRGEMYYRTIRIIPRFTELLVFYGAEFANTLHINIRTYNSPPGYAQKFGALPKRSSRTLNKKPPAVTSSKENTPSIVNQVNRVEATANKETKLNREKMSEQIKANKTKKPFAKKKYIPPLKKIDESLNKQNIPNNINIEDSYVREPAVKKAKYIDPAIPNTTCTTNVKDMTTEIKPNSQKISKEIYLQNDLLCDICHYKSKSKRKLEIHLVLHTHDKNILKCSHCGYITKIKSKFISHMKTHTKEKPFACTICDYKCTQNGNLKRHMRSHTGEKPFACTVCDFKSTWSNSLMIHIRSHTGEKPFACTVCDYKCTQNGDLKTHMRSHTGEKSFACTVCDFKSTWSNSLKIHMTSHTGEKPFACTVCDYKCTQNGHLKTHMRSHTGEKPFACTVCDYKCTRNGDLKTHMRSHTGEKPFACTVCDYKCTLNGNLKTHMRSHTGEKPFACTVCDYKCTRNGDLKTHMRSHTGEKPFACRVCHYKCTKSNNLKRHMRSHTGEKPFACTV